MLSLVQDWTVRDGSKFEVQSPIYIARLSVVTSCYVAVGIRL